MSGQAHNRALAIFSLAHLSSLSLIKSFFFVNHHSIWIFSPRSLSFSTYQYFLCWPLLAPSFHFLLLTYVHLPPTFSFPLSQQLAITPFLHKWHLPCLQAVESLLASFFPSSSTLAGPICFPPPISHSTTPLTLSLSDHLFGHNFPRSQLLLNSFCF